MANLKQIKNEKLRRLVESSETFKVLPEKEQKEMVGKLKNISNEEDVKAMCEFFVTENEREKREAGKTEGPLPEGEAEITEEEERKILMEEMKRLEELDKKIGTATKKLGKMKGEEDEETDRGEEEKKARGLLEELNNRE